MIVGRGARTVYTRRSKKSGIKINACLIFDAGFSVRIRINLALLDPDPDPGASPAFENAFEPT